MSTKSSLAARLQRHEQKKARLAEADAELKEAERKARTKRLIETGALTEKASLLDLGANALYGALLWIRQARLDPGLVERWAAEGGRAFEEEARQREEGREPLLIVFPAPLSKASAAALRAAKFRYSVVLRHWEGHARFDDASALAAAHGGAVRRPGTNAEESAVAEAGARSKAARSNGASVSPEARPGQGSFFPEGQP